MPAIRIGQTTISYELRRSDGTTERRITVTPDQIEVTALSSDSDEDIASFLNRKRQWLFNTMRDMERVLASRHAVPRFATGSKIPYRGRKMGLIVRRSDAERARVTYRNGFIVDLPHWTGEAPDLLVASELKHWLRQRARRDIIEIAGVLGKRHGLTPRSIRVADLAQGWGACGPEGNVLINWHLIFAPKKVLEYVVAHELAHLRHRSHGPDFWNYLGTLVPNWQASKAWLDKHQSGLSSDFLI
jgi:predicted metal-dependent hydrolase